MFALGFRGFFSVQGLCLTQAGEKLQNARISLTRLITSTKGSNQLFNLMDLFIVTFQVNTKCKWERRPLTLLPELQHKERVPGQGLKQRRSGWL